MTHKQKTQYNKMRDTLIKIARNYGTPEQLGRAAEKGLQHSFEDALEMAYENIQYEAQSCIKGVRAIK